jgi:pimeloyl-ACP methyl ester carboxylesterase
MNVSKSTRRGALAVLAAGGTAAVALAGLTPATAVAKPAHHPSAKPTVVLVHGAFADASGWNETATRLKRDGYPVLAVSNPLRGVDHDAAYLAGQLKTVKGPKILVGHSYGGAVITNAAAGNPDVKALVYVAAFAPDQGEALGGLLEQHADPTVPALPQQAFQFTRPDGTTGTEVLLDQAEFRTAFAADVPAREAGLMAASQRPIAAEAFGETTKNVAWKTIPSWAIVATKDHAIAPSLERFMAKRAGSHVTEVDSSHAVMVSHPGAVTRIVETAARATR